MTCQNTRGILKILSIFLFVLVAGIVFILLSETSEGKTIIVDDDGGQDYTTIQDAIDAAEEGDIIKVYNGTYKEDVIVNKTVTLIGNGSSNTTVEHYWNEYSVINIERDWVNISGFRVIRSRDIGAGIDIRADHCRVVRNRCISNGHGIRIYDFQNYNTILTLTVTDK